MRRNSISTVMLTLGVMLTTLLPCRGQSEAGYPPTLRCSRHRLSLSCISPRFHVVKPIITKKEYKRATFYITDPAGKVNLGTAAEPLKMNIRGRGHSSWKGDKKPYKLDWTALTHGYARRISTRHSEVLASDSGGHEAWQADRG